MVRTVHASAIFAWTTSPKLECECCEVVFAQPQPTDRPVGRPDLFAYPFRSPLFEAAAPIEFIASKAASDTSVERAGGYAP